MLLDFWEETFNELPSSLSPRIPLPAQNDDKTSRRHKVLKHLFLFLDKVLLLYIKSVSLLALHTQKEDREEQSEYSLSTCKS